MATVSTLTYMEAIHTCRKYLNETGRQVSCSTFEPSIVARRRGPIEESPPLHRKISRSLRHLPVRCAEFKRKNIRTTFRDGNSNQKECCVLRTKSNGVPEEVEYLVFQRVEGQASSPISHSTDNQTISRPMCVSLCQDCKLGPPEINSRRKSCRPQGGFTTSLSCLQELSLTYMSVCCHILLKPHQKLIKQIFTRNRN